MKFTQLIIIIMFMSVMQSFAQLQSQVNIKTGTVIVTSGSCVVTLAGFLTAPDVYWAVSPTGSTYNTTLSQRGNWQRQSFFQQGPKTWAIMGGTTVTVTGLITLIFQIKK